MIELTQPGTGKTIRVEDGAVEFWTERGYRAVKQPEEPKPVTRRASAKK